MLYEQQRGLKVVACCDRASQRGIVPGMPVAEATALAEVRLELYDPAADRAALEQLAAWCEPFSPAVGLEEADRPECLLFDITGLEPLFGDEQALAEQVARSFARRRLTIRLAIADAVGAAWALAHYADDHGSMLSTQPAAACLPAVLTGLPVAALRLPGPTIQVLSELGIRQIEQLLALPRSGLAARFEPHLLLRLDQMTGARPETIAAHRPPPEITAERELEYPVDSREAIELILTGLIQSVSDALTARRQGAVQLECRLDCQPADCQAADAPTAQRLQFVVGLFQASASPRHLLELCQMHLERLSLPGPASAVRLAVLLAAPTPYRQRELFADRLDEHWQLALLIDRLSGRLQRESVLRATLQPDAQPEFAFRYEPLAGNKPRRASARRKLPERPLFLERRKLPERPLFLERRPVPLEMLSVAPPGSPMSFCFRGRQHRVMQMWGPERIQTGWWRGSYIRRDYYRVQTDEGNQFWLFRRRGNWFLHGMFS